MYRGKISYQDDIFTELIVEIFPKLYTLGSKNFEMSCKVEKENASKCKNKMKNNFKLNM